MRRAGSASTPPAITLSFTLDPLTLSITNGTVQLNRATGAGATKLDWATFTTTAPSLTLQPLTVTDSTDLHVSGTATISLPGLFTATGTGSLDLGQVTGAAPAPNAAQVGTALRHSRSPRHRGQRGGRHVGATRSTSISITQGAKSWLGVDASGDHASRSRSTRSRSRSRTASFS